ncbi:nitroreductase family protein [Candidatus Falkowbacteria bacterium]|uniref:Nitroreductase n=1 Tax=Candidatus Falkowbacteria bacterium CG10_big_fil_rev_8_21_14_0_10_37_18 TaxID=1974562 RepID=A0A2H0V964_9BACT|nr:nitroreductase family protein [Candidatus Falkowbacteria bacterium]NCQ12679.1 nitroreductase family protein [Candidatus Falkowbacteria bacterium]OIO06241.1 MAG: hypothetical protein AUJ26_01300 [Candidatus Falkowbacteria bacterium CG1_02_37_21]PIR95632.1 MAG: nitroreductase [Candidatus Falkowbacteria bacterium CG10_big_fil_rev_8_21_14_0_10_37_18]
MSEIFDIKNFRSAEHEINPLILSRWSSRAFDGRALTMEDLSSVLEAAKWAPSSANQQPWLFIYAFRDTSSWIKLFTLLNVGNQEWVDRAGVLVVLISKQVSDRGSLNETASFDAGAAWENLALEATSRGLVAHAMAGFDYEKAREDLKIPDDYKVEAMIALGYTGDKKNLSEKNQVRDVPSQRKALDEIISEGEFKF